MDVASLQTAGLSSGTLAVLFILYRAWGAAVGRRLISDCCGRRVEVGVDVRDMAATPTEPIKIKTPATVDAAETKGSPS